MGPCVWDARGRGVAMGVRTGVGVGVGDCEFVCGTDFDDEEEEAKPKVVEEEEDNTLTLDQYLAQKAAKELAIPKVEPRQANEGANDDLWKDAVAISNEQESYFVGKVRSLRLPHRYLSEPFS